MGTTTTLIAASGFLVVFMGWRYLRTDRFMPYHAAVAGQSWEAVDDKLKPVILGMLRVVGGGFLGLGVTDFWLGAWAWHGVPWLALAVLTISCSGLLPMLAVSLWLRRIEPTANSPVQLTVVAFAIGVAAALFAPSGSGPNAPKPVVRPIVVASSKRTLRPAGLPDRCGCWCGRPPTASIVPE